MGIGFLRKLTVRKLRITVNFSDNLSLHSCPSERTDVHRGPGWKLSLVRKALKHLLKCIPEWDVDNTQGEIVRS